MIWMGKVSSRIYTIYIIFQVFANDSKLNLYMYSYQNGSVIKEIFVKLNILLLCKCKHTCAVYNSVFLHRPYTDTTRHPTSRRNHFDLPAQTSTLRHPATLSQLLVNFHSGILPSRLRKSPLRHITPIQSLLTQTPTHH